jgi:methyl-accepting chemotaxis protein
MKVRDNVVSASDTMYVINRSLEDTANHITTSAEESQHLAANNNRILGIANDLKGCSGELNESISTLNSTVEKYRS